MLIFFIAISYHGWIALKGFRNFLTGIFRDCTYKRVACAYVIHLPENYHRRSTVLFYKQ